MAHLAWANPRPLMGHWFPVAVLNTCSMLMAPSLRYAAYSKKSPKIMKSRGVCTAPPVHTAAPAGYPTHQGGGSTLSCSPDHHHLSHPCRVRRVCRVQQRAAACSGVRQRAVRGEVRCVRQVGRSRQKQRGKPAWSQGREVRDPLNSSTPAATHASCKEEGSPAQGPRAGGS